MIVLKNLAESFVTSAVDASATQITIPADHAGKFPNLLAGDNFRCALVNPATEAVEFINVTARNNNVLTVSRGEEGTAALAFPVESRIHMRMTAKTWEEMAAECWMRPKDVAGDFVLPQYESADCFSITGDFTSFFTENRAVKVYPNQSVGFVESAAFADGVTIVRVIEMTVPADLTHVEAGLDPDALAKRSLSNEELLGYMTPVPILQMSALEVDGGTLVSGTIKHPEAGKTYPVSTEFNFNLPDGITDFSITGQAFQMRMPVITELESPKNIGPITCRAAQLSLILSDPSNAINIAVRCVAIKAGVTLSYADTEAGYPGADVNVDGAQLPATTAGLDNPTGKAIVSGTTEFEVTGGRLDLLDGTSESVLKLTENYIGPIVTEHGDGEISSCVEDAESALDMRQVLDPFGDGSGLSLYTFEGTLADAGPYDRFDLPTGTYITGKCGQGYTDTAGTVGITTVGGTNMVPLDGGRCISFWAFVATDAVLDTRVWNLQGGSDSTSYTTDVAGLYVPYAGKVKGILNSASVNGTEFNNPGDWFLMIFESSPTGGGKIYMNNSLIDSDIPHVDALFAYRLYKATSASNASSVDQVRIFNRVLNTDERALLLTETKPGYAATLAQPLSGVPSKVMKQMPVVAKIGTAAAGEPVAEEFPLTIEACVLSGNALKYTCAKVPFTDPNIKRLSLSFSGDSSLRVKAAKIYTEEGA